MKFTPSDKFNAIAQGASKVLQWRVYVRTTSALSTGLATGTWIEVTSYAVEMPPLATKLEYGLGQLTSDSVRFRMFDVDWWVTNWLGSPDYIELKVTLQIGLSEANLASDVVVAYAGFLDKKSVQMDETSNTLTFDVRTLDHIGEGVSALNVSTQYIDLDVDGFSTAGLIMPNITGLRVIDANVINYVLQPGLHTLSYEFNGGARRMKLDDGRWVSTTSVGSYTLGNGDTPSTDTERLIIYFKTMPNAILIGAATDDVIVVSAGNTLPRQWHYGHSLRGIFANVGSHLGVTANNLIFDTLEIDTEDGSNKLSYFDVVPGAFTETGRRLAVAFDGTNHWVGVGTKLYRRDPNSVYTLVADSFTDEIVKLSYNARNNQLFIITYGTTAHIYGYVIATSTLSTSINLVYCDPQNIHVIDYNFTGSSYKYVVAYIGGGLKQVDIVSWTDSMIFTDADLGYGSGQGLVAEGGFSYYHNGAFTVTALEAVYNHHRFTINSSGNWVNGGTYLSAVPLADGSAPYSCAAYHPIEDRIYYAMNNVAESGKVKSHIANSNTSTEVVANNINTVALVYNEGAVYGALGAGTDVYRLVNNVATIIDDRVTLNSPDTFPSCAMIASGGRVYGIDTYNRLFQIATMINMYALNATFPDMSVTEAFRSLCGALAVGKLTPTKRAYVYRRGDENGDPITTGNTITLNNANCSDLTKQSVYWGGCDLVRVTNGTKTVSYDGTNYNVDILDQSRVLDVTMAWADNYVLKDVVKWLFQYYSTAKSKYMCELAGVVAVEYEPFDGASLNFTGTIDVSGAGIITDTSIDTNGIVRLGVLI